MVINEKYCGENENENESENENENKNENENENENDNKVVVKMGGRLKTINRDDSRFYDQRINGF